MQMVTNVRCPVCGGRTEARGGAENAWIESHAPGPDSLQVPLYRGYEEFPVSCFTRGLSPEDAVAVARIQDEEGDRLRLAAHP